MKSASLVFGASLLAAIVIASPALARNPPASAELLRGEIESALRAKDTNAFLALVNWEGVSAEMKTLITGPTVGCFQQDVASVTVLPLPANFQPTNELNGVRYRPNVTVVGLVQIDFLKKERAHSGRLDNMQMPYGESGGGYYIAGTVEERIAAPATPERSLGVTVVGSGLAKGETFTGSYVYVKAGKEIKETLSGKGNGSVAFWGDYLKSCRVQLVSEKDGPLQLVIAEAGKELFRSRSVTNKEPAVYEDAIDQLVTKLSATHGLWINGVSPILALPASASVEQVLVRVFEMTGFDRGHVTSHQMLTSRKIEIAGGPTGSYTAVLVDTNLGRKIVLLQRAERSTDWWSRVYEVADESSH